jgi:DNA mismatch repair protein MutH
MGYIAVDFDRTLATYDHYEGPNKFGKPIPKMVERVKKWLAKGIEVRIMTARVSNANHDYEDIQKARVAIQKWCLEHVGKALEVTCEKDYAMMELWDDRAVGVIPNTGERADGKEDED